VKKVALTLASASNPRIRSMLASTRQGWLSHDERGMCAAKAETWK
jgi:hypothetical protein